MALTDRAAAVTRLVGAGSPSPTSGRGLLEGTVEFTVPEEADLGNYLLALRAEEEEELVDVRMIRRSWPAELRGGSLML